MGFDNAIYFNLKQKNCKMKFIIIFQLIAFCICETNFNNSMLLDHIKSDKSWKDLKVVDENTLIKIKKIDGFDLPAISVQRVTSIDPNKVKDILIDILNYNNVLKSSGSLKTKIISKNNQYLDGYQYIKSEFSKMFPEDKKHISLENWDKFENSNPNTFYNMYQFWVRKT